jgi:hypothetical protein
VRKAIFNVNNLYYATACRRGKATDLTEDVVRNYALANGLVDIKVCAVSEEFSGLKLVVRLKDR